MTIMSDDDFVRLFQQLYGLKIDGWAGNDTVAMARRHAPPPAIPLNPIDPLLPSDYWPLLAQIESSGKPYAKAPTSSASGLYQFIKSTWEGEGGVWGNVPSLAFGGLKPSEAEQLERVKTFTTKNARDLRKKGIPINKASLYAAHFLGVVTAGVVIAADVGEDAAKLAGPAAVRANKSIFTRTGADKKERNITVGEFLAWLHKKTGDWAR